MNEYYGIYDYKESDTFRPTLEKRIHKNAVASKTLATRSDSCCVIIGGGMESNLRIRKLTPRECFRLMGVKDKDSNKVTQSDAGKYHLAGDSIVTTCLMGLFGELLGIDYKSKINELVEDIVSGQHN